MTKIFGSLVVKNEASRYLDACLKWMTPYFDEVFVYDDMSDDSSVEIAKSHGCHVSVRDESTPSFLSHEAGFRFAAWRQFESSLSPRHGDWILSFDADEFLVNKINLDVRDALENAASSAAGRGCIGVVLPFPEIFKVDELGHHYRVDGFWGQISGPRFFSYQQGATWKNKPMGCGSEPEYVAQGPLSRDNQGLVMLHYGYANPADQEAKYKRYSSLVQHGHDNSHIESIVGTQRLVLWDGPVPEVGSYV